jgi:hypothetical protein
MILDKLALLWSDPGTASVCALYAGVVGIGFAKGLRDRRGTRRKVHLVDARTLPRAEAHEDGDFGSGIDRAG